MNDKKTRVKDLAQELGVSTKELLPMLRDLGVSAKSTMSVISDEDLAQVRERAKTGAKREVMRKETASGVIVRRRKAKEPVKEAEKSVGPEETLAEPVVEPVVEPAAEPEKAEVIAEAKQKAKPKKVQREEVPAARIVKPAKEPEPVEEAAPEAVEPPQPVAEPAPVEVAAEEPVAEPVAEEAKEEAAPVEKVQEAPAQAAQDEEAGEAKKKKKKKKPKKREEVVTPQVRVISRPDPAQVAAQAAAQEQRNNERSERREPRGGRPGGGRPNGGRPGGGNAGGARPAGRPGGFRSGPAPAAPVPGEAAPGGDSRKKRGKGKRTVEFSSTGKDDFYGKDDKKGKKGKKGKGQQDEWQRGRRPKKNKKQEAAQSTQPLKAAKRKLKVEEAIRVSDMAHQMGLKAPEIIKVLMQLGTLATINQSLDFDTASVVAGEFGWEVEKVGFSEEDYLTPREEDKPEDLTSRPPVITIMGHVDHGKTSLLDAIRQSNVTDGEAGGITQHIGAYLVKTSRGELCFLDTPGHEAFTAMRARGAEVTDLVIIVVAADDGVMEQTKEAISHAKAAEVPIVVAVNKMDKEGANPDRVMREMAEFGLVPEDWGGDIIFAPVSAKTRTGLDELLEMVALQAEVLELKANAEKPARGHIVEAKLDKGRGPVGTVLVQEGMLRQGDPFVCGTFSGRVRAMFNDQGKKVKEAGPSTPVEVQGFDGVPEAGEEFVAITDEKVARRIADQRAIKQRERDLARESKVTLETFLSRNANDAEAQVLNVVLKADVQGSVEAIADAVRKLATEKVRVEIIHSGAGAITESDILLASASEAIIIGFNVRPTVKVKEVAEQEGVDIRFYDIIYKLVDEMKAAMTGMLAPVIKEQYLGQAEVRETFSVPKIGVIAGCMVADGKVARHAGIRLLREGVVIYTGKVTSLKRFKDDAKEVLKGYECGIGLENFNDIKVGDFIEAFEEVEEAATL